MSTRIEKDFYFQTAVHFEGKFYVNSYDITLSILVETTSIGEQNIAMERTDYFLTALLQNSVLVHNTDTDAIKKYMAAGLNVCELPEEPYDQILSLVLLLKLNAIMEGRLQITDLVLGSVLSEGVRFTVVSEVAENIFAGNHWWNNTAMRLTDLMPEISKDNIVKLFNDEDWADIGLSWKEKGKK